MESIRTRVESWIRDQTARIRFPWPPAPPSPPPQWSWPPWKGGNGKRERERRLIEERERQRRQLEDLCRCVKADSIADLQEILCSMVLSECVYKSPANEMIRAINKFKSDFGGQVVSLERVQPSLDHVPHRYLLAESGDTLFASFIGTKQYKDVIADVNIFQGAIFNEDNAEELALVDAESDPDDKQKKTEENIGNSLQPTQKNLKRILKPAAHRGFLARAKGIPALELYRLAQKKNRKLVLCGHSLGGAVAALATLAILRIIASTSFPREHEKVQIKCITFSQPPVGNAALRDYVHQKGWKHYFKTYCIPEDLVPRILSPAYFHHYNAQTQQASTDTKLSDLHSVKHGEGLKRSDLIKSKDIDGEQLVLGLGPVQTSLWRLLKLVPLDGIRKHLNTLKRTGSRLGDVSLIANRVLQSRIDESEAEPESLVIQEGSDGISLTPLPATYKGTVEGNGNIIDGKNGKEGGISERWRRVPYLPSYIPFGQLYLLGSSSVESLSGAEYSKLTSVKSVITELRERFQSHSMKSYRSRFQKMYDTCMCINVSPFLGIDQLPQFPHLPQWLGLTTAGAVELGHIVESPVIKTATSIIPLGWNGVPGEKITEPLKVDVVGHGLHLCTLVHAQVNGIWCSTAVETLPSMPPYSSNHQIQPNLQKLRILVGAPLKRLPKPFVNEGPLHPIFHSSITECVSSTSCYNSGSFCGEDNTCMDGLNGFVIYCITDFITVSKKVYFRTRRVRFLGLEGAGKTSLFNAILDQGRKHGDVSFDSLHPEMDTREGVAGGLCYLDCEGVKLQQLHTECSNFKVELQMGAHDLSKKTDLIVLVHNLSQKIPLYHPSNTSKPQPALWLLLNEARALGTPWVLAITNKFSVGAHQQKALIDSSMNTYQATPDITEVINSRPFPMSTSTCQLSSIEEAGQPNSFLSPFNLARMPFQKKTSVLPVEGVTTFRELVHRVLQNHEEMAFQELANERLSLELAREQDDAIKAQRDFQGNQSSITAAAVGASLGAGLGLVMAIVMGAASAMRKP